MPPIPQGPLAGGLTMSVQQAEWRAVGLREAADQLRGTAADYRQMAEQVEIPARSHFSYTAAYIRRDGYVTAAKLLDGQAKHIEDLA